jgi:phosphoribosylcarboxyaminoimidazole (NCAIR) mutase
VNIACADIRCFLYTGPRVVKEQEQSSVTQSMLFADMMNADRDLTVAGLTQRPGVVPSHTYRMAPLLGNPVSSTTLAASGSSSAIIRCPIVLTPRSIPRDSVR